MKSKIVTIAESGRNQWKDKELIKHFVQFENGENGTLTTGFTEDPAPVIGDELEYTIEDNGFGKEVKLPKKAGSGFGGAKKWTPEQVAQQDAVKITCAYIENRTDVSDWKQFFVECKSFMIEVQKPADPVPAVEVKPAPTPDKLPF